MQVVFHCGFDFCFPDDECCWVSFQCSYWPLYVFFFFWKNTYQILCPFFNQTGFLMLSCSSSLHSLDINPSSDASFANIFSHSVGCSFVLLIASFAIQSFFSLMWSHLFIFALLSLPEDTSKVFVKTNIKEHIGSCFLLEVLRFQRLHVNL